jgi:hypothetical protein
LIIFDFPRGAGNIATIVTHRHQIITSKPMGLRHGAGQRCWAASGSRPGWSRAGPELISS